VAGRTRLAAGKQNLAQVPGGHHHVDGRLGPHGDLDGLGCVLRGRIQLTAGAFDRRQDRQSRTGPGGIADRPHHGQRLLCGCLRRRELPEP
jgi:hypothetical protein